MWLREGNTHGATNEFGYKPVDEGVSDLNLHTGIFHPIDVDRM
jgi:hypothetical protein